MIKSQWLDFIAKLELRWGFGLVMWYGVLLRIKTECCYKPIVLLLALITGVIILVISTVCY